MTPKDLADISPKPVVIDLRLSDDYQQGHLPGAHNNCVFEVVFGDRMSGIVNSTDASILIYGANSSSHETDMATTKLERLGYTSVEVLEGGFKAWVDAGLPLIGSADEISTPEVSDGEYAIDIDQSQISWTGRNLLNKHTGTLAVSSGKIEVAGQLITRGEFNIDMNAIHCTDLEGEQRDGLIAHLKSDDFFDTEVHPTAHLSIHESAPIDANTAGAPNLQITGELEIKGKTVPVQFVATCGQTPEGKLAAQGLFSIDRTLWGVIYGSGKFFHRLAGHLVNDLIDIEVKIVTE